MKLRLLLIRHGEIPSNVSGHLDTAIPGPGLTELGFQQALSLPHAFANTPVHGIYVSQLVRTHQTAVHLSAATGIHPVELAGLNEITAGDLELRTDAAAVDAYRECGARWAFGDLEARNPGGENGHAFLQRFNAALDEIASNHLPGHTVAVIGHGAAIRVFSTIATGTDPRTPAERALHNTGMVELSGDSQTGWSLTQWHENPIGGEHLVGGSQHDVTADPRARAHSNNAAESPPSVTLMEK